MKRDFLIDYLNNEPQARKLYRLCFLDVEHRRQAAKAASQKLLSPVVLAELERLNAGVSPEIDHALARIKKERVAMVVTGQQLGFLGGPLLTLYKALAAVKLAAELERESGIPTIPVFWLQSEDHDFAEIRDAHFLSEQEELLSFPFEPQSQHSGDSVGRLLNSGQAAAQLRQLLDGIKLGETEQSKDLLNIFSAPCTYSELFQKLFHKVFGRYGLLLFDADSKAIKTLAKDLIATCFYRFSSIERVLTERAGEILSLGYEVRVRIREKSPLFFVSRDGRRQRLEADSQGKFVAEDYTFSQEELFALLEQSPESFTSSALIRPVLQDYLLPTAAYVAGSSEFSYWAQIAPLYEFFNLAQPVVVPRPGFVLFEKRYGNLMHKLGAQFADLALSADAFVLSRFHGGELDPERIFGDLQQNINAQLGAISGKLSDVDRNLLQALNTTQEAVRTNIGKLRGKYERSLGQREVSIREQFERLRSVAYPRATPQERTVSWIQYYLKYGAPFVDKVFDQIQFGGDSNLKLLVLE